MKRTIALLLAMLSLVLCGCTHTSGEDTVALLTPTLQTTIPTIPTVPTVLTIPTQPTMPSETEPAQPDPTEPIIPDVAPDTLPTEPEPEEPVWLYHNPLTGQGMDEMTTNRPYAVVFNNIKAAMPQSGIGSADVVCEILVEGAATRCLGVFTDITAAKTLGSIRSARPYFVSLAQSFDAIFVHAGRSEEAQTYLNSTGWDHMDGVHGSGAGKYFYRDQDRKNAGYAYEHTLFIKPEDVIAYAEKLRCKLSRSEQIDYGWAFGESSALGGSAAGKIQVWFNTGSTASSRHKSTTLDYNEEDGLYYASQYGSAWKDQSAGTQLAFTNVLILRTAVSNQGDAAGHLTITLTGSGTGYYACGGELIPVKWSRKSTSEPFSFTTEDGEPLVLAEGKSYIAFTPKKGVVSYE